MTAQIARTSDTGLSAAPPCPLRVRSPEEFRGLLVELRAWAGQPSLRTLRALGGRTVSASGHQIDRLPPSTTSDVLTGRSGGRLPRWEFTAAFVAACLRAGRWPRQDGEEYVERWRLAWRAVDGRVAAPDGRDGVAIPEAAPAEVAEASARPTRRRVVWVVAGVAVGLLAGITVPALMSGRGGPAVLPPGPFARAAGETAYGGLLASEGVLWLTDNEPDGLSAVLQHRVVGDPEWQSRWNKNGFGTTRRWVVGPLAASSELRVCLGEGTGPDLVLQASCGPILVFAPSRPRAEPVPTGPLGPSGIGVVVRIRPSTSGSSEAVAGPGGPELS